MPRAAGAVSPWVESRLPRTIPTWQTTDPNNGALQRTEGCQAKCVKAAALSSRRGQQPCGRRQARTRAKQTTARAKQTAKHAEQADSDSSHMRQASTGTCQASSLVMSNTRQAGSPEAPEVPMICLPAAI